MSKVEKAKVYLRRVPLIAEASDRPSEWQSATHAVVEASGTLGFVRKRDLVAVKLHVGEPGLKTALPPEVAASVVRCLRDRGARPFLTDTAVLYSGPRCNGAEHAEVAYRHGFRPEITGAAFVPADGLKGNLERSIAIDGIHYRDVKIATALVDADGIVVLSHATGHMVTGFGGTLKNLGMGCASRKGKLQQHSDTKPSIRKKKCTGCGECIENCPEKAMALDGNQVAVIDDSLCIGCGECIARCSSDAVGFSWDSASQKLQEKMVEHALGVIRGAKNRLCYVLGIVNLTKDCDCIGAGSAIVAKDVGFAVSSDPVAIDQAAMDLVCAVEKKTIDKLAYPAMDANVQLAYAEKLGLGTRNYELIEV
ncbi:MAG: DUF362 domain-containing protein [Polyangiaceae bacterium]|nr:DUF362 domain-containing protein [Polyangiaceae bacterium]